MSDTTSTGRNGAPRRIRLLDLNRLHAAMLDEIQAAIREVVARSAFAGGPFVEAFERDFADYCEVEHAVGVGNGTEALWLSLVALGIGPGDEVITVPNSFVATAEAIRWTGARPVFVDVDPATLNMDPERLASRITPRTGAILPVHLYGQAADLPAILGIAEAHGIPVIEDASQAHGARFDGRRVGGFGQAGCFSFYPGKNLGAWGEAGAIVTRDSDLADGLRQLRNHGRIPAGGHGPLGWNGRMDGIQAAVLRVKLRHLDAMNERRRAHAAVYRQLLGDEAGWQLPFEDPRGHHVYHHFVVRVRERDGVLRRMERAGIECGVHYPVPIHQQPAFLDRGDPEDYPVTERAAGEVLSLPMDPGLTGEELSTVAGELRSIGMKSKRGDHALEFV